MLDPQLLSWSALVPSIRDDGDLIKTISLTTQDLPDGYSEIEIFICLQNLFTVGRNIFTMNRDIIIIIIIIIIIQCGNGDVK